MRNLLELPSRDHRVWVRKQQGLFEKGNKYGIVQEERVAEGVDGEADREQSSRDGLFALVGNLGFIQSAIYVPLENFKPESGCFLKDC